jgi:hypothetical protein
MALDKDLYRKAYKAYQEWNEVELIERIEKAGQHSSVESWYKYVDLWESARKMMLSPGEWQRIEKLTALERYYSRILRLEDWRSRSERNIRSRSP